MEVSRTNRSDLGVDFRVAPEFVTCSVCHLRKVHQSKRFHRCKACDNRILRNENNDYCEEISYTYGISNEAFH